MKRVSVVGTSGVGKSTLADVIGERLGVAVIELDALMHGPNWAPKPTAEFRSELMEAIAAAERDGGGWVIPGNYRNVADLVQQRADTIVWLDLPLPITMWRLLRRSVTRAVRREEVWGGNRESLRNLIRRDPERNVLLWAWTNHPRYREVYEGYANGPFWEHAAVHRMRTSNDVERFVDAIGSGNDR